MANLLFNIIAWAAVAGFVLGIISGFWPVLLVSVAVALLSRAVANNLER